MNKSKCITHNNYNKYEVSMLQDFHVHSDNSFDSKEIISDVCSAAVSKNITHIAFTEHFSAGKYSKSYGYFNDTKYFSEINEAKEKFKGALEIYSALEVCEPHLFIDDYRKLFSNLELDFLLGSVHNIGGIGLNKISEQHSSKAAYDIYFNEILKMAMFGDFDVAAHLDLMTRYAFTRHGDYKNNDYIDVISEIFKALIKRGKGIEINNSGLRKSLGRIHPKIELLKLYKDLGGVLITIGSDAHAAADVGAGCITSLELLKSLSYNSVFTFKKRQAIGHKIT